MRRWGSAMEIDKHIEQPDDDYSPREVCSECGGDVEDDGHDVTCSHHESYYDRPEPEYNKEDDCGDY